MAADSWLAERYAVNLDRGTLRELVARVDERQLDTEGEVIRSVLVTDDWSNWPVERRDA